MITTKRDEIISRNNHLATMAYLEHLTDALESARSGDILQREELSKDTAKLLFSAASKHANMCTISKEYVYAAETLRKLKYATDRFPECFSVMQISDMNVRISDNYRNLGISPSGYLITRK